MYRGSGDSTGGRKSVSAHEYFSRLSRELISILDEHHPQGRMYRVDMRLRPEGASGEITLHDNALVNYYYNSGRPWERQALVKIRRIAGCPWLSKSILTRIRPWVYPQNIRSTDLADSRKDGQRVQERRDQHNLKTGAGGIRDIEFLAQYYQLGFAHQMIELRTGTTLDILDQLRRQRFESRNSHSRKILYPPQEIEHRLQ